MSTRAAGFSPCSVPPSRGPVHSLCLRSTLARVDCAASTALHPSLGRVTRFTPRCSWSRRLLRDFPWRRGIAAPCAALYPQMVAAWAARPLLLRVSGTPGRRIAGLRKRLTACSSLLCRQEASDRRAGPIDGAIPVIPLAFDLDGRRIQPPAAPHWPLAAGNGGFALRTGWRPQRLRGAWSSEPPPRAGGVLDGAHRPERRPLHIDDRSEDSLEGIETSGLFHLVGATVRCRRDPWLHPHPRPPPSRGREHDSRRGSSAY
jgi:hypothetical protein